VQNDQIRKEADDTGPLAEFEYWRLMTARFNSILEQIRSHNCRMAIHVLHVAKSKILKVSIIKLHQKPIIEALSLLNHLDTICIKLKTYLFEIKITPQTFGSSLPEWGTYRIARGR